MKAITLIRPWAWALFHGKPVENRTWRMPSKMIGQPTAIHAGQSYDTEAERFIRNVLGMPGPLPHRARATGIIGVVTFVRVSHVDELAGIADLDSCWFNGPYGWWHDTSQAREFATPIPCKGKLGLWALPADVEASVREQLR